MRLLNENNSLINIITQNCDWMPTWIYYNSQNLVSSNETLFQSFNLNSIVFIDLFNVFFTNFCTQVFTPLILLNGEYGLTLLKSHDLYSSWISLFYILALDHVTCTNEVSWVNITHLWNMSVSTSLIFVYFILLLWKISIENMHYTKIHTTNYTHVVNIYLYTWILGGIDKTESFEEIISLLILWPWCVLLVFTHLFSLSDHNFLFGFAEWGLPILYGLILLAEHCWAFGTYFLVYLTGTRARKSLSITLLEDIVAVTILLARVLLQAVRGVIVGMFHFICREALLNMTNWWTMSTHTNSNISLAKESMSSPFDYFSLTIDLLVAGGSFVIVTAIMFLQLTFLVVSVWLFCKCWFISWQPNINPQLGIKSPFKKNVKATTQVSANAAF